MGLYASQVTRVIFAAILLVGVIRTRTGFCWLIIYFNEY